MKIIVAILSLIASAVVVCTEPSAPELLPASSADYNNASSNSPDNYLREVSPEQTLKIKRMFKKSFRVKDKSIRSINRFDNTCLYLIKFEEAGNMSGIILSEATGRFTPADDLKLVNSHFMISYTESSECDHNNYIEIIQYDSVSAAIQYRKVFDEPCFLGIKSDSAGRFIAETVSFRDSVIIEPVYEVNEKRDSAIGIVAFDTLHETIYDTLYQFIVPHGK